VSSEQVRASNDDIGAAAPNLANQETYENAFEPTNAELQPTILAESGFHPETISIQIRRIHQRSVWCRTLRW
jgi:hypothetical protein